MDLGHIKLRFDWRRKEELCSKMNMEKTHQEEILERRTKVN